MEKGLLEHGEEAWIVGDEKAAAEGLRDGLRKRSGQSISWSEKRRKIHEELDFDDENQCLQIDE